MSDTKLFFTSVRFKNFKAFEYYSISLNEFNVLVGPNNAGKSTILSAFKLLAAGIRQARSFRPEWVKGPNGNILGYQIPLLGLPMATENIFTNYDDSEPAYIVFRLNNGNRLTLYFPKQGICNMVCDWDKVYIKRPKDFKEEFNVEIDFVPILGPVERNEQLYQKEAARKALLTYRASRNLRNIWYHFPEDFDEFRDQINSTWYGMDIERPEADYSHEKPVLHMFCKEERILREIFWSGFGFQVWCQMLTYITKAKNSSILLIDEPDIYLHSDLQRQLIGILKRLPSDILIATHSTEIISECNQRDLLVIDKNKRSGKRIKNVGEYQILFENLGSNLNPILTQLAKTKNAIFVEGNDFSLLSKFARELGKNEVANRSNFAIVPLGGFRPQKVKNFSAGIEAALGFELNKCVILDRDYRSNSEVEEIQEELDNLSTLCHIFERKEIENYLLDLNALKGAISKRIDKQNTRSTKEIKFKDDIKELLLQLTGDMKSQLLSKFLKKRRQYHHQKNPKFDDSTIDEKSIKEFEESWSDFDIRIELVPGKKTLSILNSYLQEEYGISLSNEVIISNFKRENIPDEIRSIIGMIEGF